MSAKGITFHALLFQDKLYNSDVLRCDHKNSEYNVQAVPVYGRHMQTVRGTVSIIPGKFVLCF